MKFFISARGARAIMKSVSARKFASPTGAARLPVAARLEFSSVSRRGRMSKWISLFRRRCSSLNCWAVHGRPGQAKRSSSQRRKPWRWCAIWRCWDVGRPALNWPSFCGVVKGAICGWLCTALDSCRGRLFGCRRKMRSRSMPAATSPLLRRRCKREIFRRPSTSAAMRRMMRTRCSCQGCAQRRYGLCGLARGRTRSL